MKYLIQQRSASTSEPFPGIKCTFKHINTIGKTKETKTTKEVKANSINTHRKSQNNQQHLHFQTHVAESGHGSERTYFHIILCIVVFCLVFSMFFDRVCLGLFGCFGCFGFPDVCFLLFYVCFILFWLLWFSRCFVFLFLFVFSIVSLSVCLETIKYTCLCYRGFTVVRSFLDKGFPAIRGYPFIRHSTLQEFPHKEGGAKPRAGEIIILRTMCPPSNM